MPQLPILETTSTAREEPSRSLPSPASSQLGLMSRREQLYAWVTHHALRIVLTLFVLLATTSSIVVPPFETPDEIWHFAFIQQLASGGGLPLWEPDTEMLWEQEGGQAPGYYLAAAALTFWIDQSDFRALYDQANPFASIGFPEFLNRGYLIHHPEQEWPWRGSILALHIARFFSVFLGVVALWAIYQTLALLLGPNKAVLGTALIAFIPQWIFISGAATNDNAMNATAALLLWRLVALLKATSSTATVQEREALRRPRTYLIIGLFAGLAMLSKLNGISLTLLVALTLVVVAYRMRSWRLLIQGGVLVGGVALLISGWWYLRNWLLYNDPLARQIWFYRTEVRPNIDWIGEIRSVEYSFWGLFGWFNITYPAWVYSVFRLIEWAALLGLALASGRWFLRWRAGKEPSLPLWRMLAVGVLLAWLVGLTVSWVQFHRIMIASQGRLFQPTAPTLALLLVVGLSSWRLRASHPPLLAWGVVAVLLTMSALTPWLVIQPAYSPSELLTTLPEQATPTNIQFGDSVQLEGYSVTSTSLAPSQPFELTLYWRALQPIHEPLAVSVKAFGRDDQLVARDDSYPDAGRWLTTSWPVGSIIVDRKKIWLSGETETPAVASVTVDLYHPDTLEMLPTTQDGQPVTALPLHLFDLTVRQSSAAPAPAANWTYRPVVQAVTINAGEIEAEFRWEVGQPLSSDYHAFFHLAPSTEQPPIAQEDFEPIGGDFPTSQWWPGDRLPDHATLSLPEDAAPGEYVLLLGLYDLASNQRVTGQANQSVWVLARLQWDGEQWRKLDD